MLGLVCRAAIVIIAVAVSCSVCHAQERQVVAVVRDDSGDLVTETLRNGECMISRCDLPSNIYLVETEECRPDTELQPLCRVKLVPQVTDDTVFTDSISTFIGENGNLMVLDSATNQYGVGRIFNHFGERQDGTNCTVTRLSTRGRTLNHDGFSVNSGRGEIKVFVVEDELAYPRSDYDGELYLMNINSIGNIILNDPLLRYIIIGSAVGIGILMCLIILIVGAVCYRTLTNTNHSRGAKGNTNHLNTASSANIGYLTPRTDEPSMTVNRAYESLNTREQGSAGYAQIATDNQECLSETKSEMEIQTNPAYLTHTRVPILLEDHQYATG